MVTKREIRTYMLNKRASLSQADRFKASSCAAEKLFACKEYQQCSTLFCYVSFRNEVDTLCIIEQAFHDGKQVAVPRVEGKDMKFYRITSLQGLVKSSFGIMEPSSTAEWINPCDGDLMLVPGAAFDKLGYRIGYGGGYYDRYLKNIPNIYTIGLAYDFQIVEELPKEAHDLAVRKVILSKTE